MIAGEQHSRILDGWNVVDVDYGRRYHPIASDLQRHNGAANMFVATNGTFARSTSSGRYKTNVEDLWPEYRDVIMEMRPVWYRSLCPFDNPDWSYIGLIAEEVGGIEPRLVHWRTEEIVDEEVDREVMVSVERKTVRTIETPITEFVDTGRVDDDGQPVWQEVQWVETTTETVVEMVEEQRTIKETVQRSVPLETPVAEGIMYERLVVHLIAKVQQQQAQPSNGVRAASRQERPGYHLRRDCNQ